MQIKPVINFAGLARKKKSGAVGPGEILAHRRGGRIVPILTETSATPFGSAPGMPLSLVWVLATIDFAFTKKIIWTGKL
jgi:hypothetical protein